MYTAILVTTALVDQKVGLAEVEEVHLDASGRSYDHTIASEEDDIEVKPPLLGSLEPSWYKPFYSPRSIVGSNITDVPPSGDKYQDLNEVPRVDWSGDNELNLGDIAIPTAIMEYGGQVIEVFSFSDNIEGIHDFKEDYGSVIPIKYRYEIYLLGSAPHTQYSLTRALRSASSGGCIYSYPVRCDVGTRFALGSLTDPERELWSELSANGFTVSGTEAGSPMSEYVGSPGGFEFWTAPLTLIGSGPMISPVLTFEQDVGLGALVVREIDSISYLPSRSDAVVSLLEQDPVRAAPDLVASSAIWLSHPPAVPEPSSITMLLIGIVGIAIAARKTPK